MTANGFRPSLIQLALAALLVSVLSDRTAVSDHLRTTSFRLSSVRCMALERSFGDDSRSIPGDTGCDWAASAWEDGDGLGQDTAAPTLEAGMCRAGGWRLRFGRSTLIGALAAAAPQPRLRC